MPCSQNFGADGCRNISVTDWLGIALQGLKRKRNKGDDGYNSEDSDFDDLRGIRDARKAWTSTEHRFVGFFGHLIVLCMQETSTVVARS